MIELVAVASPPNGAIEQIVFIENVGRVVSFNLEPGGAVPETREGPLLMVAVTDLELLLTNPSNGERRLSIEAGHAHLLSNGVAGLENLGKAEARFTLVDLPNTD